MGKRNTITISKKCANTSAECIEACVAIGCVNRIVPDESWRDILYGCLSAAKELGCHTIHNNIQERIHMWEKAIHDNKILIKKVSKKRRSKGGKHTERDIAIWLLARRRPALTQKQIGEMHGLTPPQISIILRDMAKLGGTI